MDARDMAAAVGRWWKSVDGFKATPESYIFDGGGPPTVDVRFEVCGVCGGSGKYVNPSIDAHGLTREDFEADPDFREEYFSGTYDMTCAQCGGQHVIPVPTNPAIRTQVAEWYQSMRDGAVESAAEREMGA